LILEAKTKVHEEEFEQMQEQVKALMEERDASGSRGKLQ
jgi:hypothetical protein